MQVWLPAAETAALVAFEVTVTTDDVTATRYLSPAASTAETRRGETATVNAAAVLHPRFGTRSAATLFSSEGGGARFSATLSMAPSGAVNGTYIPADVSLQLVEFNATSGRDGAVRETFSLVNASLPSTQRQQWVWLSDMIVVRSCFPHCMDRK